MPEKTHPHPSAYHVMTVYRRHILACKKKYGRARGVFAYREIVLEYLRCKPIVWSRDMARLQDAHKFAAKHDPPAFVLVLDDTDDVLQKVREIALTK